MVYLDLYSCKVWGLSIFSFFTPPGDIYGRPLLSIESIFVGYLFSCHLYTGLCSRAQLRGTSRGEYRQRLHLVRWHSPRVRYWLHLGTNVNTPFSQVPTLEFGHGAGVRPCTYSAQKWAQRPCVYTAMLLLRQSNALYSLLAHVSRWRLTRRDGVTMYAVTLNTVLKVWKQLHFLPVPKQWFPSTKCGQPLCLGNT